MVTVSEIAAIIYTLGWATLLAGLIASYISLRITIWYKKRKLKAKAQSQRVFP